MPTFGNKHYANPAYGKGMENSAKAEPKPPRADPSAERVGGGESHGHPPAHTVSVHKAGGKFHSAGFHEAGVHSAEHGSQDEAMSHAKGCMGAGGMSEPDADDKNGWMGGGGQGAMY